MCRYVFYLQLKTEADPDGTWLPLDAEIPKMYNPDFKVESGEGPRAFVVDVSDLQVRSLQKGKKLEILHVRDIAEMSLMRYKWSDRDEGYVCMGCVTRKGDVVSDIVERDHLYMEMAVAAARRPKHTDIINVGCTIRQSKRHGQRLVLSLGWNDEVPLVGHLPFDRRDTNQHAETNALHFARLGPGNVYGATVCVPATAFLPCAIAAM